MYGFSHRPLATSEPSTVDGTRAGSHPSVANPGREIASPEGRTSAELRISHSSDSILCGRDIICEMINHASHPFNGVCSG